MTEQHLIESEEQILLNQLAKGDRTAFWQLWEIYRDYLYDRCRVWMGGNHHDAEEAISLVVLKAWDKLPNYASDIINLRGWLNRLAHNLCVDVHRRRKREPISTDSVDGKQFYLQDIETSQESQPESALLQQELKIYLRHCIQDLPDRLQHPLILHYYQGMSCTDIAQELAISLDNAAKRLQQARNIIRKHLYRYTSGLSDVAIDEAQLQQLEQADFQVPIPTDAEVEEINYRIALPCLETLPPIWYDFHYAQDWM
ncbi:MAG: RNA polymerase sigma factor [Leptolyngbya sp. SIO1D8]|nr:RNA polymerase sigma factor [Leptolyngbya sp. SIO1D8]